MSEGKEAKLFPNSSDEYITHAVLYILQSMCKEMNRFNSLVENPELCLLTFDWESRPPVGKGRIQRRGR